MLLAALIGFVIGWVGSIPVAGPISALVVTRGLEGRFRSGIWVAVGGAVVEALYALLAFWGFSTFLARYPIITPISRGGGAVVLLALGLSFLFRDADPESAPEEDQGAQRRAAWRSFALGAWICAINPTLIATWTAVVTTLHGSGMIELTASMAPAFAIGCALGIAGWFTTLLVLIRRHRGRFSSSTLRRIKRAVGVGLVLLAAWFAWRFVESLTGGDQAAAFFGPTSVSSVARATSSPARFLSTTGTS